MPRKKKAEETWKCKDGSEILLKDMSDQHLANSIKMTARQCMKAVTTIPIELSVSKTRTVKNTIDVSYITRNTNFKKLSGEAQRRKFKLTLFNDPIMIDGRLEYVEVFIPTPQSKISASFFPTDWDSRPQE